MSYVHNPFVFHEVAIRLFTVIFNMGA